MAKIYEQPDLDLQEAVIKGVVFETSHNEKWAQLDANDSPLVRAALIRANQLRMSDTDPGDAYLAGIADVRACQRTIETASMLVQTDAINNALDQLLQVG